MKTEIGPVYLKAGLAHPRIERVGRDRIGGLRRTLEVDFAVTGQVRIRAGIAFRLLERFRRLRVRALPAGTRRDRALRRALAGAIACQRLGAVRVTVSSGKSAVSIVMVFSYPIPCSAQADL